MNVQRIDELARFDQPPGLEAAAQNPTVLAVGKRLASRVVELRPEAFEYEHGLMDKLQVVEDASEAGQGGLESLTDSQLDVAGLISLGVSERQIAERLICSLTAVKFHTGNILKKFNVWNRVELGHMARRAGILRQAVGETAVDRRTGRRILGETKKRISELTFTYSNDIVDQSGLTPREIEIIRLAGVGYGNEEISELLSGEKPLAVRTVRFHLSNAYGKLGVSDRSEAGLWVDFADKGIRIVPAEVSNSNIIDIRQRQRREVERFLGKRATALLTVWAARGMLEPGKHTPIVVQEDTLDELAERGVATNRMIKEGWVNLPVAVLARLLDEPSSGKIIRNPNWRQVALSVIYGETRKYLNKQ